MDHFHDFFEPRLKESGYSGIFKMKTKKDEEPDIDGCALFYKTDRHDLRSSFFVFLCLLAM